MLKKALAWTVALTIMAVNFLYLPGYSYANEPGVTVESTYGDGLSYYAVYNYNGQTYRSDQIGPAMNRHLWKKLSDEDREKVNKTLYNYGDKVAQFGKEGADEILDWHKSTDQYSEAKALWQERIMNKYYPELQAFYEKSFEDHYPGLFDSVGEGGTPVRCDDKALNEAYEQKKTEITQAWQDGGLAYGQIKSMKTSQIAYSVNVGSQAIIKMLADGFFTPHATRGAAVMSDALAQVFDAVKSTYDSMSSSDPSPGEVIQAIENILDQFAGVAEDKKAEVEQGVIELNNLIDQMRESSLQSYADYQAQLEEWETEKNIRSAATSALLNGEEDCGVGIPALPAPDPEDGLSEEEKEAKEAEIVSALAELQETYNQLQSDYESLMIELEDMEEAALACIDRTDWPSGEQYVDDDGYLREDSYMSEIYDLGAWYVNLSGQEYYFDPLVEITDVEGIFGQHPKEYVDNIGNFYDQTESAYSGMIDKLTAFNNQLDGIIAFRESFYEELATIIKKQKDITEKDESMYYYYLEHIIEIDRYDLEDQQLLKQEAESTIFINEYPDFEEPDYEKYHQVKNEVTSTIEHYTDIVENVIPQNKVLWTNLYTQYLAALDAVYARYEEYKVGYENAVSQMAGATSQLNQLYEDPCFIQSTDGYTSYYYDGTIRYAENAHGAIDIDGIKARLNNNYADYEQILAEIDDLRQREGSLLRKYTIAKNHADYYEAKLQHIVNSLGATKGSVRYDNLASIYDTIDGPGDIKEALLNEGQKSRLALPVVGSNVGDVYDMLLGRTDSYWKLVDIIGEIQEESSDWRDVSEENYENQIKISYQSAVTIYTEQKTGAFLEAEAGIGQVYTDLIDILDETGVDYAAPVSDPGDGLSAENPVGVLNVTNIQKDSATFAAKVYRGSMNQLDEAGFLWTDDEESARDPMGSLIAGSINKLVTQVDETTGEFSNAVNNLEEGKEYYVYAYAVFNGMIYFSDDESFTATNLSAIADLSRLELSGVSLNEDFTPGTMSYTASVANGVNAITVTATVLDPKASYVIRKDGTVTSNPVALDEGANEIVIVVTAENGTTTKSYTITVTRQYSGSQDDAGVVVNPTSLNLAAGENMYFSVVLGTYPEATVTVSVYGGDYLTLEPGSLEFDESNWNIPQSVRVGIVGDGLPPGLDGATVTSVVYSGDPYYNNIAVTPVTVSFTGDNPPGEVQLPSGTTNSAIDLSTGVQVVSGGLITIGGQSRNLAAYTGGDLDGVDLTAPQNVGDRPVQVERAVRLKSGIDGQPVTITNSDLAGVSATIPDGTTIMAPSGWDGTIVPPKATTGTGTAPAGYSVGGTVIEVGSPDAVLLFDRPVILTLQGVTGPVGYKPAGSNSWVRITRLAGGTYDNPVAPPFPGEAYITNGTDTKIITWHFTSFAGLVARSTSPSGGGSSSSRPAAVNEVSKLIRASIGGKIGLEGVIVHVPSSSISTDAHFSIRELTTIEQNSIVPSGKRVKLCGSVYDITTTGSSDFGDNPITVKITYDPATLAENEEPVVYYYNEEAGQWMTMETTIEYNEKTQTHYAVTNVNHLTRFAVFATEKEASTETSIITLTIGQTSAIVESQPYTLDALPYVDERAGRTLVPVRFVSEALGAAVKWEHVDRTVTVEDSGKTIILKLGSRNVLVDGVEQSIDCVPAVLPPGRTFVPLRFVSETLGAQVDYKADTGQITITR